MRTLLIDGDIVAFIAASGGETVTDWDEDTRTVTSDLKSCIQHAEELVESWKTETKADAVIICLSDPSRRYFRHDIFPEYKAKRVGGRTPDHLIAVKEHLATAFPSKRKPKLEADDVLGILATHPTLVEGEKVIATSDKDLRQLPGLIWNPRKTEVGVERITEAQGLYFFLQQAISGDPTDGIPGCPKMGPKKAKKLLDSIGGELTVEKAWPLIVQAYEQRGKDEDFALQQARVVKICQTDDWNMQRQVVIPWNPN